MSKYDSANYEKIKAAGDLPSAKGAALSIIRLTQKGDVGLAELDRAIRADPAFVGRLIKAANLVNGPASRSIVSVREALMVLGIPAVRTLALGFSLLSDYKSGRCAHFGFDLFWSRSLVSAIAFQTINVRTRAAQPDEAFSVGLLSHIGELALATLYPEQYDQVLKQFQSQTDQTLLELEHDEFFINHAELSAAMLGDWGLPAIYLDAIFFHEQPVNSGCVEGSRPYLLCHSLALANHIADICLSEASERKAKMSTLYLLGARLSIESETLNNLCDSVTGTWPEWASLLSLSSVPVPAFSDIASQPLPPQPSAEGEQAPLSLLIIDDDKATRMLLKAFVEAEGYQALLASNGEEGFNIAVQHKPDIIITDWLMPLMDGMELTKALRQTKEGRSIYIMIMTAIENDDALIQAFEAGVDDFIHKPLRPKTVAAHLIAGRRMIAMQRENERDREALHKFAAELSITNRRLQEMAMTDVLTGFPNRRYATECLAKEWSGAVRNNRPLSCLIIDIDEFKLINDTHGHDVGDKVLQQVAQTISEAMRTTDFVCRMGGDEFIVVCPDTSLEAALACAERIRAHVEPLGNSIQGAPKTTVSIGVSIRDINMKNPEDMTKRADEGVYHAKQTGRNRVACLQITSRPGK